MEVATKEFVEENTSLLNMLFSQYALPDINMVFDKEKGVWRYTFVDVVLNTRLGSDVSPPVRGPLCGDNGGRTVKGDPCKLKGKRNGRCGRHPGPSNSIEYNVHDHLDTAELVIEGDNNLLRPIPADLPFKAVTVNGLTPIDLISSQQRFSFTSGSQAWDMVILKMKDTLKLQPESLVQLPDGNTLPVDPLWLGKYLYRAMQLSPTTHTLYISGAAVQPNYLLQDYSVDSVHYDNAHDQAKHPVQVVTIKQL